MIAPASWMSITPLAIALFFGAANAGAAVRVEVPEQAPGPPIYARIEEGRVVQDGTWAAIVFYRPPECVPPDFNLIIFFDAPRAFGCPLTMRGFEIWKNGPPPLDLAPIQTEMRGLGAVPVWFVKWSALQAAMADGILTVPELWAMPSLRIGSATYYHETLRPLGGAERGSFQIVAHGLLSDGTAFELQFAANENQPDVIASVKIAFR